MKLDELSRLIGMHSPQDQERSPDQLRAVLEDQGIEMGAMYQELEMSHRFVDTHRDESGTGAVVPLHSHSFSELIYCRSNCGVEYLVGSNRYRLQRGDIVLVGPGVSHRPLIPRQMAESYRRYVLWISREFINLLIREFARRPFDRGQTLFLLRTAGTHWEGLGEYFRRGVEEAERRAPGWEVFVTGNTMTLLTLLGRAAEEDGGASQLKAEEPELLDLVMNYIEGHLADQITLADTARRFWVSESTVSQTFRQKMGVSFYRCVTQRRLISAKSLILQNVPLKSVHEQVGFSDYSAFFRAFKREYGISPRQFRQLQEEK